MVVLGEHREAVQHQHPQSVSSQKKKNFRKRCFSGGDVCRLAPAPPPLLRSWAEHRQILFSRLALGVKFS